LSETFFSLSNELATGRYQKKKHYQLGLLLNNILYIYNGLKGICTNIFAENLGVQLYPHAPPVARIGYGRDGQDTDDPELLDKDY
jgi:hypothetical protein